MDHDVAVLGAGPTGLIVANLLGRAGLRVALIERNPGTVDAPRAVSIDDESLRTVQATGFLDAVLADIALDYGSDYYSRMGGRQFLSVSPDSREYGFPKRSAFSQPLFEATLRRGLDRFPNVTQIFGQDCAGFSEDAMGVTLDLPGRGAVRAGYLVGCDGGRSATRKAIGAQFGGATYQQRWLIVDLASSHDRARQTRVNCDPARPFISLPGPHGIRRYEFLLHDHEDGDAICADPARLAALMSIAGPDADRPVVRRQVYTFHARIADRWQTDRVFLAGDAAHLSPPFAGQGMNSGIRDAHNIAWKLAAVVSGQVGQGLLKTYQTERKPHATQLIDLAVTIGKIMVPPSRLNAALVQTGFRATRLIPRLQAYFAQMKYKPKPFFAEGFVAAGPDPLQMRGRMCPQPELETAAGTRVLLDDLAPGFQLIAYGHDAQASLAGADALDFGIELPPPLAILPRHSLPDPNSTVAWARDIHDRMARPGRPARPVAMILRPDRYVAAASDQGAADLARQCLSLMMSMN
ncbi:bifunctional 3-(3-hydroxy-phenyl)propionate/3-hydroxycinnamic acid hydroxylase [Paracoccus sp. M683]|uniref:bifunctional 3-(3-hydroxy-phenyl)propionate/3-hydroxycinnamic acid hydroxylase n=1 Tax=Paracoccus sp. M683 TaxID=2594268 RepID=UPI00117DB916|nr:bifunctional 3-(3-hydroxy-phenyl)propionate/3-hydroxycinnamic acid hydroxylase [Paracoccus sp. M683]TRW93041.1 bifunctional 3-(3-hydroxy-phenyl)propionate/3-hydroxycinnamic acid hydroxylase [Paracoccus sp. M683]